MEKFLNDYMDTLTNRQRRRVSDVLDEVKVSKEQLNKLVDQLSNINNLTNIIMTLEEPNQKIAAGTFISNLRDIELSIRELYRVTELTGLIISTNHDVLLSEIQEIEQELIVLERMAQNYSFLLADNNAFNYAYMESFVDENGRDTFDYMPDRGGLSFGPAQKNSIDINEGILVLPRQLLSRFDFTPSIIESNVGAFLDDGRQSNLDSIRATTLGNGWRQAIYTPAPVTSSVSGTDISGAGVVIEGRLSQQTACSEIRVTPYAGSSLTLAQVSIYDSDNGDNQIDILPDPVVLDGGSKTIHFPMTNIQRFTVTMVQPAYSKVVLENKSEGSYRKVYESIRPKRYGTDLPIDRRYSVPPALLMGEGSVRWQVQLPMMGGIDSVGFATKKSFSGLMETARNRDSAFLSSSSASASLDSIVMKMIGTFDPSLGETLNRRKVYEQAGADTGSISSGGTMGNDVLSKLALETETNAGGLSVFVPPDQPGSLPSNANSYVYDLGLASIQIGIESVGFKGFFVSNPFDSGGDMGEIRIKVSDQNYRAVNLGLDNSVLTSVEYSVSNKANPTMEGDWVPVLPIGSVIVESERLFPDDSGVCHLRFLADPVSDISVYKNGSLIKNLNSKDHFIYNNETHQGITAISMPFGSYGPEDFITATYAPAQEYTVVNFEDQGFDNPPLISAYDEDGAGEAFDSLVGRNETTLSHSPFVDKDQVASSTYVSGAGLSPYQPIVVRLRDGTVALNLTNYKLGEQAIFPSDTGLYFIHSGNTLIFNKEINQPFRVFYQYLQNNVRVRVVMRCNSKNFVTPKSDFFHLKGKTRRPDREKI